MIFTIRICHTHSWIKPKKKQQHEKNTHADPTLQWSQQYGNAIESKVIIDIHQHQYCSSKFDFQVNWAHFFSICYCCELWIWWNSPSVNSARELEATTMKAWFQDVFEKDGDFSFWETNEMKSWKRLEKNNENGKKENIKIDCAGGIKNVLVIHRKIYG